MPTTPTFYVNSPSSGSNFFATAGYQFIPNNGSSITVTVHSWTGANGGGSLVAVTTLVAETFDVTTSTNKSQNSASGANTSQVISSNGTNGSNIFAGEVRYTGGAIGSLSIDVTYTGSPVLPAISSFSPGNGSPGTSVTLTGTHFTGVTSVDFNGVTASSFTVTSDTSITVTVPVGATTGRIHASNPSGTGTSATNYIPYDAPTIASFSPGVGAPGTVVTISGSGFTGTSAVDFNGVAASFVVGNNNSITATVPAGATAGPIHVTNPMGTATSATNYIPGIIYGGHIADAPLSLLGIFGSHTAGAPVAVIGVYRGPRPSGGAPIQIW